jgi:outer membrane autotransporter protein
MITTNINTANTAFLSQSGAFVGSPTSPTANQTGGGVWARGIGGEVDFTSKSSTQFAFTSPTSPAGNGVAPAFTTETCNTEVHASFGGVQLGSDISKLNVAGWNVHWGLTAGALYTSDNVVGGVPVGTSGTSTATTQVPFSSSNQLPFLGGYLTATRGNFFADLLVRGDFYQSSLNSAGLNLYDQKLNARGISVGGSVGYQFEIPNQNWFIEPSAGLIWSRVSVDPLTDSGPTLINTLPGVGPIPFNTVGTTTFNDFTDTVGRLGVRVGTAFSSSNIIWQPFAAASVWHDFGGNYSANYSGCPGCVGLQLNAFAPPNNVWPASLTGSFTGSNFGTYGQYSLGLSGQIINTGWLGFVRVDYRESNALQGWDATGGIRYQFTPEVINPPIITKAPVYTKVTPSAAPISWGGFYIGGFAGSAFGTGHFGTATGEADPWLAGFLGGGLLGYNYQLGHWVLGVEGDLGWTGANGGTSCGPSVLAEQFNGANVIHSANGPMFNTTCNSGLAWIDTATARLGYTWWDRVLSYVKVGAAWAHESFSAGCNFGPINAIPNVNQLAGVNCTNSTPTPALPGRTVFNFAPSFGSAVDDNRIGWTVGLGVEFALTQNWSTRAEYDYMDFGSRNRVASDGSVLNVGTRVSEAKVGVTYRFGDH